MGNAARKARKKAGGQVEKTTKMPTPIDQRARFVNGSPRQQIKALVDRDVPSQQMETILRRSALSKGLAGFRTTAQPGEEGYEPF